MVRKAMEKAVKDSLHEAEADDSGKISFLANETKDIELLPLDGDSKQVPDISRSEVLDFGNECFLLNDVLSESECKHAIAEGERAGFLKIYGATDTYRSSQRMCVESAGLAGTLWQRIQPWLKDITIEGDPHTHHIHGISFLRQGTWTPIGLNPMFRLCRYLPGGHFAPHFDGHFVQNSKERSLQTFMLYLNGDFEGGSTNFVDEQQELFKDEEGRYCAEEKNILCHIYPKPGLAIVFNHHRLHEGQKLGSGMKYILRTDIMYRHVSANKMSDREENALQLAQEAERKEAEGACLEAVELYRKAFKLSPEVASAYGN